MDCMSRRKFLQQGTAAAVALVASRPLNAWAASSGRPIGIQLYTVGADLQKNVPRTLEQIRAIGYTEVETAGFAGLTGKQFSEQLKKAGLNCHSAHLQLELSNLSQDFDDAHAIGAHFVVCSGQFPGSSGPKATLDDYKKMAERLNTIAQKAKQNNLQYAYHNHNFEFRVLENHKIGYDVLLEETDPALVDFELDCGWMVAAEYSPVQYFQKYPHRYKMLHIKDFVAGSKVSTSLEKGLRPQGTELGRGHIDYKPILTAAAGIGINHYFVEQEPPFLDMPALAAAKVDYNYLSRIQF